MALTFYTSVANELKLKVTKFQGLILTFPEVTGALHPDQVNVWLYFINNMFPTSEYKGKVFDQPISSNLLTKLDFNSYNPYFHGQTLWKDKIISFLIFGAQSVLIGLQNNLMAIQFPVDINLSIYTFIQTLQFTEWAINQISYDKMRLHLILYSIAHCKLSKTILGFISGLINLNYTFHMPFKVSPKAKPIINGAS